jgi:hypothetical protein
VHYDGAKPQNCVVKFFCTKVDQILLSLLSTREKSFSFHFKHYNLTIRAVNFFETFCTCSPRILGQDLMVKIAKRSFFSSFLLLELELAEFEHFFVENDLRPLGVKA